MWFRQRPRAVPYLRVSVGLALVGVWPLVTIGAETGIRVWGLAGIAFLLGMLLAIWLRARVVRGIVTNRPIRLRFWIFAGFGAVTLIGFAPPGPQLVFQAASEGFVAAVAAFGVSMQLKGRRVRVQNDETRK